MKGYETGNPTSSIEKIIGRHLREKRLKRGFTLAEVASKIGISYQQIQKYEQAISKISAGALYRLSSLYGVGIEKFFEGLGGTSVSTTGESINIFGHTGKKVINLLLVEDNPGDETITRKALNAFGDLNILCVHDGGQTMEVLRYKTLCPDFPRPDLIFLDIYIPRRDGIAVLKEIKRDREIQDIPVVILTNNTRTDLMAEAYKNGASGYICKSFDFITFRENLTDCIKYWSSAVVLPSAARRIE
ncbi:MAG: response regulator [Holosporales bacterium]|jgi:CheY-like chemotaxis protein|nr:response regulator [Holosporales bacterium]